FYQGNAFLAKNESEKAIEAFQKFMPFSDLFDFTATTQWYLGLSYLSNQQKSEAIQQLRLLENDPDYGNKARQVIAEINQLAE
ncbi:MAG: tetratricopeptide repeat protein, partial [Bacteroidota bacterium]